MSKRDPYVAIMVASARGVGLHLTPEECDSLSLDDAIATRAANSLDEDDFRRIEGEFDGWASIDPKRERKSWNGACRDPSGKMAT